MSTTDTGIEWCDRTWNPVRGCSRISEGCRNCYAERVAARFSGEGKPFDGFARAPARWTGKVELVPDALDAPLRWRKPARIFVNSMSDLFHEKLSDEDIAAVFGVMAAAPQHRFLVLTKRAERMRGWFESPGIVDRIDLFRCLALAGRLGEFFAAERAEPIAAWPGYWITTKGRVLSDHRGERRELQPMPGEQGHSRVMLYRGTETWRPLIHRLVLATFDGGSTASADCDNLQGCHIDGNAENNALWNLRWGSQASNWTDSKRHGTRRRYSKLTDEQAAEIRRRGAAGESGAALGREFGISDTQARNIISGKQWAPEYTPTWPLPGVWLGVSVEDQATADARIPHLLATPAAVRFVSYEPALGGINFRPHFFSPAVYHPGSCRCGHGHGFTRCPNYGGVAPTCHACRCSSFDRTGGQGIDWLIVGGESGPGARPFDVSWARSAVEQCKAAGVACFVKQLGARPFCSGRHGEWRPKDRKGGDPSEWAEDLRVREFPRVP